MNLDKQDSLGELPAGPVTQRFYRSPVRIILMVAIGAALAGGIPVFLSQPKVDLTGMATVGIIFATMIGSILFFLYRQQVEINGTTVRYSNASIQHRSRIFDVADVIELKLHPQRSGDPHVSLMVTLQPSPTRKWVRVDINSLESFWDTYDKNIDSPMFLAFFAAVQAAHPSIKVGNLPDSYRGPLPRA